jgi:hypothetical protein
MKLQAALQPPADATVSISNRIDIQAERLPLVFGAFGEGNRELHTFLEVLAKASVTCPGMAHVIPPGASATASYSFALSEMRRVVGLTISRCNSSLKIQRLPTLHAPLMRPVNALP